MIHNLDNLLDAVFIKRSTGKEYKFKERVGQCIILSRMSGKQEFLIKLYPSTLLYQLNLENGTFYIKSTPGGITKDIIA